MITRQKSKKQPMAGVITPKKEKVRNNVPITVFGAKSKPTIVKTMRWHIGPVAPVVKTIEPELPPAEKVIDGETLYLKPEKLDDMMIKALRKVTNNVSLSSSAVEILRAACHQHFNIMILPETVVNPIDSYSSPLETSLSDSLTPKADCDDMEIAEEPNLNERNYQEEEPSTPREDYSSSPLYANEPYFKEEFMDYEIYDLQNPGHLLY